MSEREDKKDKVRVRKREVLDIKREVNPLSEIG